MDNNHKIIMTGTHKERGTEARLLEIRFINPDNNRNELFRYEIQEYSPMRGQYVMAGFNYNRERAIDLFLSFYNQSSLD